MCLVQSLGESDTRVSGSVCESLIPMCLVLSLGESDTRVSDSVFGRV